jgi:ribosomal protein S18 acetylase RimI-like enzyme
MNMTIRPSKPEDQTAIAALWQVCGLTTSYNDPATDFAFARAKPNSDVLIGTNNKSEVIASVMVGHDGHRGWIYYVAVDPQYRNQKLGRHMVQAAEQWLKEKKIVKVMLLVRETNTQVIDFYKHIGYESIPRTVMQKWLND